MVPVWLISLPLKNDMIEAKVMHEQLCSMVVRLGRLVECLSYKLFNTSGFDYRVLL